MKIDLNKCFPVAEDGSQGPLPRQLDFLRASLDVRPGSAKYIRYLGGIGSGKTMIGCITVLSWAVLYPGDYLIGRQFFPELRDTTLKTFLEICPKELLLEYRVADGIVRVKSQGGASNILFRHLEDPEKHRSLNLNGFYIDESSQVSEEAFLLLQGRLRGKHVRKGILTTNSAGRNWGWRYFVQMPQDNAEARKLYLNLVAPSTENKHLPPDYVKTMLATWSEERIRREILADEDMFEGAVYPEFRRDVHVIKPFAIPDEWERVVGIDHGYRNPAAALWCAVDYDGNLYFYREYYQTEQLIEEIVKGNRKKGIKGILELTGKEKISDVLIDPSTKATRGQTGVSDFETYLEHLPRTFPLRPADNTVMAGIDRVKSYLKLDEKTKKPRMYIFDTCPKLIEEMLQYRWKENTPGTSMNKNNPEEVVKKNDHACDAARYIIMSRPEVPKVEDRAKKLREVDGLEGVLRRELHGLRTNRTKDILNDL